MKLDKAIKKETAYITLWVIILSVLTQAVFLIIGKWDYTVLLGNVLSGSASILNFLLMGISVQKSLGRDEKSVKQYMKGSSMLRTFMLFAIAAVGVLLPVFSTWTVLIPLFFPRIAFMFRPLFAKKMGDDIEQKIETQETSQESENEE